VADTAERIDDLSGGRVSSAYRYYRKLRNPRIGTPTTVGRRLASETDGISSEVASRVMDRVKTVGSATRVRDRLRQLPAQSVSRLTPDQQRRLGQRLQRLDSEFLRDARGRADLSRVTRFLGTARDGVAELWFRMNVGGRLRYMDADVSDQMRWNLRRAWEDDGVTTRQIEQSLRRYDRLDGGSDLSEYDSYQDAFEAILNDEELRASWLRTVGQSDVDTAAVQTELRRIDQFMSVDRGPDEIAEIDPVQIGGGELTSYATQTEFGGGALAGNVLHGDEEEIADVLESAATRGDNSGEYIDPEEGNVIEQFENLDPGQKGEFVEEQLAPELLEQQYGYDILCTDIDCGLDDNGIDIMAWDPDANGGDGELVIIESK